MHRYFKKVASFNSISLQAFMGMARHITFVAVWIPLE
jgi:hypothetical protein